MLSVKKLFPSIGTGKYEIFKYFREPSEKTVRRRSSSLERPVMKTVGDYKGLSKLNMKKSNNDYHISKVFIYNIFTYLAMCYYV